MMTESTKGTMIRALLTAALLATTVTASAAPALAIDPAHAQLLQAVQQRGIKLYNDADLCEAQPHLDGFYHGPSRALVICAEGSWEDLNANDLDTIRHETVHFIQDCANDSIDGNLQLILKPGVAENLLRGTGLPPEAITRTYTENGKAQHVPIELEAFGVARAHSAKTITKALNVFCPLK